MDLEGLSFRIAVASDFSEHLHDFVTATAGHFSPWLSHLILPYPMLSRYHSVSLSTSIRIVQSAESCNCDCGSKVTHTTARKVVKDGGDSARGLVGSC